MTETPAVRGRPVLIIAATKLFDAAKPDDWMLPLLSIRKTTSRMGTARDVPGMVSSAAKATTARRSDRSVILEIPLVSFCRNDVQDSCQVLSLHKINPLPFAAVSGRRNL